MTPDLSYYYWEGAREWCEDNKWDEEQDKIKIKLVGRQRVPYFSPVREEHISANCCCVLSFAPIVSLVSREWYCFCAREKKVCRYKTNTP